jgi:hypothetical protein
VLNQRTLPLVRRRCHRATSPGGEVIVLDSGGYGPVTITQPISLIAPPGVYAGISVSSGSGISINAPSAADVIRLQGLTINDLGGGASGISQFGTSGVLFISNVQINGFLVGIDFEPSTTDTLDVAHTTISGAGSAGIFVSGGASFARASVDDVLIHHCGEGFRIVNNSTVSIRNSRITDNTEGIGVFPTLSGSATEVLVEGSSITNSSLHGLNVGDPHGTSLATVRDSTLAANFDGIYATNAANVRLAGTSITRNTTGVNTSLGGFVQSQGNNFIYGNTSDGTVPTVVGSK